MYGATRYADVILQQVFGRRCNDPAGGVARPTLDELRSGGGAVRQAVRRLASREARQRPSGGANQNITIEKHVGLDGKVYGP